MPAIRYQDLASRDAGDCATTWRQKKLEQSRASGSTPASCLVAPSSLNWTPATPTLSDAAALMVTVAETFEAFAGELLGWVRWWNTEHAMPVLEGRTPLQAWLEDPAPLKFLVNPNSPTGTWHARPSVERVLLRSQGVVVLDEAYVDFAPAMRRDADELDPQLCACLCRNGTCVECKVGCPLRHCP